MSFPHGEQDEGGRFAMSDHDDQRSSLEDLLSRASEDWVYAGEVLSIAFRYGAVDGFQARDTAIGLIARAMHLGLVVPGDVTEHGFVPWATPPADSMWRIIADWLDRPEPVVWPGEVVWLAATEAGEELGHEVWRREGSE